MGNQISDIIGRVGSIGHDIETGGSPHHGVDQIENTTTTVAAAAAAGGGGGGGATDHQEEEEADMERAAITADDPPAGFEEEGIEEVQISDNDGREGDGVHIVAIHDNIQTHGSAGGGEGATDHLEGNEEFAAGPQSVQRKRDSGIFPNISAATHSVAAPAILQPTPKGLYSEDLLIVAYTLDLIMLPVLGILLLGLTFALPHVPDNWVPAVRAATTTVTVALLVLLLFLVAFVTYGLVRQDLP